MFKHLIVLILIFFLISLIAADTSVFGQKSYASDMCLAEEGDYYLNADVIFIGEAIKKGESSLEWKGNEQRYDFPVEFKVIKLFKGNIPDRVFVGDTSFFWDFKRDGKPYSIIYATWKNGKLFASDYCYGTRVIENLAGEQIHFLAGEQIPFLEAIAGAPLADDIIKLFGIDATASGRQRLREEIVRDHGGNDSSYCKKPSLELDEQGKPFTGIKTRYVGGAQQDKDKYSSSIKVEGVFKDGIIQEEKTYYGLFIMDEKDYSIRFTIPKAKSDSGNARVTLVGETKYKDGQIYSYKGYRVNDGKIHADYNYVNCQEYGKSFEFFDTNGKISKETELLNGRKHGFQRYFNEKGDLILEIKYNKGLAESLKDYTLSK